MRQEWLGVRASVVNAVRASCPECAVQHVRSGADNLRLGIPAFEGWSVLVRKLEWTLPAWSLVSEVGLIYGVF